MKQIKVGDHVHVGHMVKGGAGARGVVTSIGDDGSIIFKSHEDNRTFKGQMKNATLEKAVAPRVEEQTKLQEAKHIVGVTLSDPSHTMATKRKEKIFKRASVTAPDKETAIKTALNHYKKQGYKVHDHNYVGIKEEVELTEYALEAPTLKKHRIGVRVTDGQTNKRKVKYVVVTHSSNKEGAQKVGEKHFRKKGDFVHGSFHSGMVQEEVEIEEAVKLGSKVKIHAPGKDYHEKVGHVGEIRDGLHKGAPKKYTVDYDYNEKTGHSKSVQLDKKNVKLHTEEVEIDEAKGALTYKPEHVKWGVVPKSSKEFVKFFPKDKEADARAHAEKTGGTLKKIDQAGRAIREDVELDEAQTPYYKKQGWIKKMSQVAKQERLAREKKEKDAQQKSVKEGTELDESLKTHYQNGYDAQKKGKTRQDNPHREGSPAASMWAKGWEHASDKKEPQKFANEEVDPKNHDQLKAVLAMMQKQHSTWKSMTKTAHPKTYKKPEEKKPTTEEVELEEAVEISHDRYIRSHGKKASGGHGEWLFTHKRSGDVDYKNEKEVHRARGTFGDAQKSAKKWAKQHGHSTAYVMESATQTNIEETIMKTFKEFLDEASCASKKSSKSAPMENAHDVEEELTGNQHKLDKNKNGKLDKQDFKMLRKEEVELEEELKGDMHPDASKVLKHIKPEHHSVYKPYLKKGTYNGSYKDRADVLKAAEKAGHTVSEEAEFELQEAVAVTTKPGISVKKESGRTRAISTHHVVDGQHYKVTSQHDGDDGLHHDIHKVSGNKETRVHGSYQYGVGGYDSHSKPHREGSLDSKVASSLYSAHNKERKKKVHGDEGKHPHELHDTLDEGWDDMKKAVAARMAAGDVRDKSKFDKKEYKTGTVYTRKRETFSDEDDAASDKKVEKQAQAASGEAPVKRGRGRPPGKYGSYKARSAETKASGAAKSAATKAANKKLRKEALDDAFVIDLFRSLEEEQDVIDFADLICCEEFNSLSEQELTLVEEQVFERLSLNESELDMLVLEVLGKGAKAGDWIRDFIKSDNPKFAGKSKEKRKQMALAAYYAKQRGE